MSARANKLRLACRSWPTAEGRALWPRSSNPRNGTTNHVAILGLQVALGIKFTVVPYKGSAPGLTDVI